MGEGGERGKARGKWHGGFYEGGERERESERMASSPPRCWLPRAAPGCQAPLLSTSPLSLPMSPTPTINWHINLLNNSLNSPLRLAVTMKRWERSWWGKQRKAWRDRMGLRRGMRWRRGDEYERGLLGLE